MASRRSSFGAGIICGTMLLAATVVSPWPSYGEEGVTLRGEVRTRDGQVIPFGVTVSLETGEGMPAGSHMADPVGNFEFLGLSSGTYHMTVAVEKFQTYEQTLDLTFRGTVYQVKVFLTPADKSQASTAALPAMTDEAAPKLARKEFEKGGRALHEKKLPEARQHLERRLPNTRATRAPRPLSHKSTLGSANWRKRRPGSRKPSNATEPSWIPFPNWRSSTSWKRSFLRARRFSARDCGFHPAPGFSTISSGLSMGEWESTRRLRRTTLPRSHSRPTCRPSFMSSSPTFT